MNVSLPLTHYSSHCHVVCEESLYCVCEWAPVLFFLKSNKSIIPSNSIDNFARPWPFSRFLRWSCCHLLIIYAVCMFGRKVWSKLFHQKSTFYFRTTQKLQHCQTCCPPICWLVPADLAARAHPTTRPSHRPNSTAFGDLEQSGRSNIFELLGKSTLFSIFWFCRGFSLLSISVRWALGNYLRFLSFRTLNFTILGWSDN